MNHAAGIGLMAAAVLLFTLNDVLGKWLLASHSVAQVLVLRSVAALAVLAPFVWQDRARLLRPARPRLNLLRVACGTLEVASFYFAVSLMPLADTMAFWMATPIFVALGSALLLGETLDRARFAAVVLGFVGVVVALGAGLDHGWLPTLVALGGTLLYAGYLLTTRALRGTSVGVLAVYQMLGALVFGLLMLPFGWGPVPLPDMALLLLLGVIATGAHLAVTRSLALAPAPVVVPWQYSMILWGILFGWLFFGDVPEPAMLVGVAIIVAAGFWLTRLEFRSGMTPGASHPA